MNPGDSPHQAPVPNSREAFAGLHGVVLAAGLSRRSAPRNKLLGDRAGMPLVRWVAQAFCEAGLASVVLVTGHQRELIEEAVGGLPLRLVHADDYARGMGHSLAAGIRALPEQAGGYLVSPADLPQMEAPLVRQVAAAYLAEGCRRHVIPRHQGERGHPVALGVWLRPGLARLQGDQGARALLAAPEELARILFLETSHPGVNRDCDL